MRVLIFLSLFSLASFAQREPEPRGYYSNGNILFAWQLPLQGDGFYALFPHRSRIFGSRPLVELISQVGAEMSLAYPMRDLLQVGDLSQLDGGNLAPRHKSHQNGLDVDLAYYHVNNFEQIPDSIDEFAEDMVVNGVLSENFDMERNWTLMKTLHQLGRVQRIFVDQVVKNELCRYSRSINEHVAFEHVLRSLRHEEFHKNHLHVRLYCPDTAKDCIPQEDPPPGSGCAF